MTAIKIVRLDREPGRDILCSLADCAARAVACTVRNVLSAFSTASRFALAEKCPVQFLRHGIVERLQLTHSACIRRPPQPLPPEPSLLNDFKGWYLSRVCYCSLAPVLGV